MRIDNTNHRYGRSTLSVASAGVHKKWNMKRKYSSKMIQLISIVYQQLELD